jgi:subtilisin-like proprotein convertase family protein
MKNNMKQLALVAAGLFAAAGVAQATLIQNNFNNLNTAIPDGNPVGTTFSDVVSGSSGSIENVDVNLDISGGYNGDLYGYLVYTDGNNDSTMSVLLNRVGATSSNPAGYSDPGMDVTLSGVGVNDIHLYQNFSPTYNGSGQVTGTFAADGRAVDPSTATSSAPQTAGLNMFNGLSSANGTWTLFLADMSVGGQSTLVSWGLDISVVPEPVTWALIGFAGILGVMKLRSLRMARKTA